MTHPSPRAIEAGAKAIARMVPCDEGSKWNPGFGEDFPREYSKAEQKRIRTIAQLAVTAALEAEGMVMVPSTPTDAMVWAGGSALYDEAEDSVGIYRAMIAAAQGSDDAGQ